MTFHWNVLMFKNEVHVVSVWFVCLFVGLAQVHVNRDKNLNRANKHAPIPS